MNLVFFIVYLCSIKYLSIHFVCVCSCMLHYYYYYTIFFSYVCVNEDTLKLYIDGKASQTEKSSTNRLNSPRHDLLGRWTGADQTVEWLYGDIIYLFLFGAKLKGTQQAGRKPAAKQSKLRKRGLSRRWSDIIERHDDDYKRDSGNGSFEDKN